MRQGDFFHCFGFYLDEIFVKTNRTKTYILFIQLTSYIDVCLTVSNIFLPGPWKWGTSRCTVEEFVSLSPLTTRCNTYALVLFKGQAGSLRVNPAGLVISPCLLTQLYLSLPLTRIQPVASSELSPLRSLPVLFPLPRTFFSLPSSSG